jgi:hypothetical protein
MNFQKGQGFPNLALQKLNHIGWEKTAYMTVWYSGSPMHLLISEVSSKPRGISLNLTCLA